MLVGFQEWLDRYSVLTAEELAVLAEMQEVRTFDKKVRLIDIGEVEQYLNVIGKGLVQKYFWRGKEQVIKQISKEGSVISSSVSYFSRQPSRYIIEAIEPTTVFSISYDNLEKLFQLSERWERVGMLMMGDLLIEKEYWLLDTIRYSPRERFLRFIKEQPDLLQRVPQKYLASYLDIKPETFSRLKHLATGQEQQ